MTIFRSPYFRTLKLQLNLAFSSCFAPRPVKALASWHQYRSHASHLISLPIWAEPPMTILGFLYNSMSIIVIAVQNFQVSVVGLDFSLKIVARNDQKTILNVLQIFASIYVFLTLIGCMQSRKYALYFLDCSSKPIFLFPSSAALVNSNNHSS